MLRLLLRLFGIKDFEVCQSCETLKQQLAFVNDEKKQLTDILINIVSPKPAPLEPQQVEFQPLQTTAPSFSRRRAMMEAAEREKARILKQSTHIGKPDFIKDKPIIDSDKTIEPMTVAQLEKELGVEEPA